jgi:hypothetical protein
MNKVKIHTTEQPNSDTTTFILSCNRLQVLDETIESFLKTRDYVTKIVIVDDSAEQGVFETLVEKYGNFSDVICFPSNRSQWWAMDFMVSWCDTEYIFYLEDDWKLLQSGYLNASKQILRKYRDIGTVDISWRTFENEGIDSYDKTLIDNQFYYKKLWRITDYHLHWYGWIGSPNLKRRDDLILLGRVEKWHNEWNIDRRFKALGFKSVFLNGEYARHLGDNCSRMAGKRPDDGTTPEDYYPKELLQNRVYPKFDYLYWDTHWKPQTDITLVTAIVDLERHDRNFEHYIDGISHILHTRHPIIVHCPEKYFDRIKEIRGSNYLVLKKFDIDDIESTDYFNRIQEIISGESWYTQSEWMKTSVIRSRYYIAMTLLKQKLLNDSISYNNSSYYYWIDSGLYNSYSINESINNFYFTKIPKDKFFMTSFPYHTDTEIHGYDIEGMTKTATYKPEYVCRASIFGGTKKQIEKLTPLYDEEIEWALNNGYIGTEESIYTILSIKYKDKFTRFEMYNGDIKHFMNRLR